MKKIILSALIIATIISACHTTKNVQRTVSAAPKVSRSPAAAINKKDSVAMMKDSITNILNTALNFSTFYGKAKADFSSKQFSGNATAYIKMQKDSIIWISITGPLNIEGARIIITPDSVKVINKLQGFAEISSINHLQQITKIPFSFSDFQSVILGKPFLTNSTQLSIDTINDSIKVSAQKAALNYIFSFAKNNFLLGQSNFTQTSNSSSINANIFYNNYADVNGTKFSTNRDIAVTGSTPMKLELNFKEYNFNQPQSFPFTIPKNYEVKYD